MVFSKESFDWAKLVGPTQFGIRSHLEIEHAGSIFLPKVAIQLQNMSWHNPVDDYLNYS